MIPNRFPNDTYDTPEDHPRELIDRLLFGCRVYFYAKNFSVFVSTGKACKAGTTNDIIVQGAYSNIDIIEGCGGKMHIRGLDNLNKTEGPVMFIGNHMSLLETVVLHGLIVPRLGETTYVVKESLLNLPYFGDIMRGTRAIAISRETPRKDFETVMKKGKALLKEGVSIILFPQSTRSEIFDPEQFNTIGIKLAKAAKVPVIPFALKTDFLTNGKIFKDLGPVKRENHIHFEFAPPIMEIRGNGKTEHQQIIDFIDNRLTMWRNGKDCNKG